MTASYRLRPVRLAQSGTLILLLLLLFVFAQGPDLFYGALSLALLAVYHILTDHYYTPQQIRAAGLLYWHLLLYLLLCTLVIWATTSADEESLYWIVYLLPITVAATNLGLLFTLLVCAIASLLYAALFPQPFFLNPALRAEEIPELLIFCLTYFLIGTLVQSFNEQRRRQLEDMEDLNRQLLLQQGSLRESLLKLEAAEESLRRKERLASLGEMSAGLAHEIRNPLGIISSSVQLLEKKKEFSAPASRELLDIVQEETVRLNGLVTDFLQFGRPGQPQLKMCDLGQIVERAVDHVRGLPEGGAVTISTVLPKTPVPALVDPDMLRQVLLNLLLNALDAVAEGGQVQARVRCETDGVYVEIHNTGRIIPLELQSRIFDPFFTTKDRGTGLGLANAHRIVESHGGELKVRSSSGEGTLFSIFLPKQEG
ncbi:MAG: ATP-binding protein [Syntrophotaleaceae bacterium]